MGASMSSRARPRMRPLLTSLRLLSAVLATALVAGPAIPSHAGSGSHCVVGLTDFHSESPPLDPFYVAFEADSNAIFTVKTRFEGDCFEENRDPWVEYQTQNGSAVAPSDYVSETGRMQLVDGGEFELVSLEDDSVQDTAAVEYFDVVLTAARSPWVRSPSRGRILLLDDDGVAPRASFHPSPNFSQSESRDVVEIPVFLGGPISTPTVSVDWSVTPESASADDYQLPASTTLTFTADDRVETIQFTIVDDAQAESNETLQVGLTDGTDYDLSSPSTMRLTIVDNEETIRPESKFHHPKNGWTYKRTDYRIREMHVFARDDPADDVAKVEMALKKKKTDGSCTWWNDQTRRWTLGDCSDRDLHWVTMSLLGPWSPTWPWLYEEDFPRLTPSIGTAVRKYTAWCRATDGAGNVETTFVKGRNWNTFEVKSG
jgi:hypothetical protein